MLKHRVDEESSQRRKSEAEQRDLFKKHQAMKQIMEVHGPSKITALGWIEVKLQILHANMKTVHAMASTEKIHGDGGTYVNPISTLLLQCMNTVDPHISLWDSPSLDM